MYAIEIDRVSKKFKERGKWFYALKDIDLRIKKGEIFSLLGPNGAGKTTLLNIIIRILTPDSGGVKILGKDLEENPDMLEQINFVSGETRFHWILTVDDIMKFYAMSYRIPPEKIDKRTKELLQFFGIKNIAERRFAGLSTGQIMRLILAKAMLNQPKVLLLDEPTLGLDPDISIRVRNEIKRINQEFGTTILLTSHYMHEVEQLSDRIAFINKGEIVDIGKVEKIKLKRFGSYDVFITVEKVINPSFLIKNRFNIKGNTLHRILSYNENLSSILSFLHKHGYKITNVETKKPTLEDYFVKIMGGRK